MHSTIKESQIWQYKARPKDKNSFLIIKKLEGNIIHLTLKNIHVNKEITDIEHIPISYEYLMNDLIKQIEIPVSFTTDKNNKDFEKAYEVWKNDYGGVWSIPLHEVVELTLKSMKI